MKLFDDIFRENVDKAFSDYNADHLADEGWNSFMYSRKKPGRHKALVIPLWAKAASIALIVGGGALTAYLFINRNNSDNRLSESGTEPQKEITAKVNSRSSTSVSTVIAEKFNPGKDNYEVRITASLKSEPSSEQPALNEQLTRTITLAPSDTLLLPAVAENRIPEPEDTISLTFKEELQGLTDAEAEETVTTRERSRYSKPRFMTGMSGVLAHVKDASSSAPGVSVGFWIEQKITERISFRPGLALAVNSLGVDKESGSIESLYQVPLIDGNSGTIDSYNGELRMIAMELPLNIVFKVFERKRSGIYLSAGASTMFYFNQKFTGDFVNEYTQSYYNTNTGTMSSETRFSTVSVNNSYSALNHTDYFGLANFSAAWSLPYGKTSTLLFEPFVQLPLRDLTALNLRVRYGGISMKVRFGGKTQWHK
jgi:hypothetical protein